MTNKKIEIPRRDFLLKTGFGLGALALGPGGLMDAAEAFAQKGNFRTFRFAVISDTHIIDEFYKGPESNPLDSQTVFETTKRLTAVRTFLGNLTPAIELVLVCGDFFHDYPSADYDFYFKNKTRIDFAKELIDGFKMPVHITPGNHDYEVPKVSREMSHRLFKEKLKNEPYYAVEHKGYKFVSLNNFLGATWDPTSKEYNKGTGSYGEQQLNWFEAQLKEGKPTFAFQHYPFALVRDVEVADYGMVPLLRKHKDTIQMLFCGHWHRWFDFAKTFGPQHYAIASTRYDENAYMIVEVDTKTKTSRVVNFANLGWATRYATAYKS